MEPVVGENGKRMDLMSKNNKDYEVLYALRDKKTKKLSEQQNARADHFIKTDICAKTLHSV